MFSNLIFAYIPFRGQFGTPTFSAEIPAEVGSTIEAVVAAIVVAAIVVAAIVVAEAGNNSNNFR